LRSRTVASLLFWLFTLLPAGAPGQTTGGLSGEAGVSRALSPSGADVDGSSFLFAGLTVERYSPDGSGLFAGLHGAASLDGDGDWASALADGDLWLGLAGPLDLGLGGEGQAFTVGEPFRFRAATVEARPGLRVRFGDASFGLVGRAAAGRAETRIELSPSDPRLQDLLRRLPIPRGELTRELVDDLWHVGGGPEIRFSRPGFAVGVAGAALESSVGHFSTGRFEVAVRLDGFTLTGDVAGWDTPDGTEIAGGLTFELPLGPGWSASGTGGRSDPDPLLRTLPGGHGGISTRRRLVAFESRPESPLYVIGEGPGRRPVRFSLRRPEAGEVALLGDFTGWSAVPMRQEDGRWTLELELEPGAYHFGFRVDGEWYVPTGASGTVSDEWGRTNATLVVPVP